MDKRALIVAGVMVAVPVSLLGIWALQGRGMQRDLAQALRSGEVAGLQRDLPGKKWSAAELETIEVLKVPGRAGSERAIARAIHARGRILISPALYAYQGAVRDQATGIVHLFGLRRASPKHWCWVRFHPASVPKRPALKDPQSGT